MTTTADRPSAGQRSTDRPAGTADGSPNDASPRRPVALLVGLVALPLVLVVATTLVMGSTGYGELGSSGPGMLTSLTSSIGRLVAVGSSAVCGGALVTAAFLRPRSGRASTRLGILGDPRTIRISATVWAVVAALLVFVDAADINGLPIATLTSGGQTWRLLTTPYLPRAWMVTVLCAVAIAVTARFSRAWQSLVVLTGLSAVGALAPVLVGPVLVGPDHDFMSGAATMAVPFTTWWAGATVVLLATWSRSRRSVLLWRYGILASIAAALMLLVTAVLWYVETESVPLLTTGTGRGRAIQLVLVLALVGVVAAWWRGRAWESAVRARRLLIASAWIAVAFLGTDVALTRIPPPQTFVTTTITQNYLGYNVPDAPSAQQLFFHWRPDLLFLTLALVAVVLYLVGVRRLTSRGDRWPIGRTAAWLGGWAVVIFTTSSGVGRYAGASFSIHMVLHMSLNMLAPVLLVLAGPVTLALRAIPTRRRGRPDGAHEWITHLLNWRLTHHFMNPLHAFITYTASYFVLYFTSIFEQASRYHWAHEVMNLEFLMVGYLFFSLVIGIDHLPRSLPHLGRLGLTFAAMPFHAFFGVAIMMSTSLIAGTFYTYLSGEVPWITDIKHDQYVGGGVAWAAGEIPLLIVVVALVAQWARDDARRAVRSDRHLDSGLDDTYDAYNEMLSRLSQRDGRLEGDGVEAADATALPTVPAPTTAATEPTAAPARLDTGELR